MDFDLKISIFNVVYFKLFMMFFSFTKPKVNYSINTINKYILLSENRVFNGKTLFFILYNKFINERCLIDYNF